MDYTLSNLVDDYLINKQRADNQARAKIVEDRIARGDFRFSPSNIGKCPRYIVYDMLGYKRPEMPPRITRITENGNYMHERYQTLFADMGVLIQDELPIKDAELCISGRTDALIRLNSELVLVELKSANQKKTDKMKKANAPLPEFEMQLQLYLHLTGIPKGIVLAENKNDQEILEFPINYNITMANTLVDKVKLCVGSAKQGILPDRLDTSDRENFNSCRWCDYNEMCWKKVRNASA
jgi:CRISPR/Cas system-associated exonuclease Cas4 (RecB family)